MSNKTRFNIGDRAYFLTSYNEIHPYEAIPFTVYGFKTNQSTKITRYFDHETHTIKTENELFDTPWQALESKETMSTSLIFIAEKEGRAKAKAEILADLKMAQGYLDIQEIIERLQNDIN